MKYAFFFWLAGASLLVSCKKTEILTPSSNVESLGTVKNTINGSSLSISSGSLQMNENSVLTVNASVTGFTSRPPQTLEFRVRFPGDGRFMRCLAARVTTTPTGATYTGSVTVSSASDVYNLTVLDPVTNVESSNVCLTAAVETQNQ